jgi:hypothetical protein
MEELHVLATSVPTIAVVVPLIDETAILTVFLPSTSAILCTFWRIGGKILLAARRPTHDRMMYVLENRGEQSRFFLHGIWSYARSALYYNRTQNLLSSQVEYAPRA